MIFCFFIVYSFFFVFTIQKAKRILARNHPSQNHPSQNHPSENQRAIKKIFDKS